MVIKKQICDPWKKFLAAFRALQGGCPCRYVRWKDPQAGWEQISLTDCSGGTYQHPRGQFSSLQMENPKCRSHMSWEQRRPMQNIRQIEW